MKDYDREGNATATGSCYMEVFMHKLKRGKRPSEVK